MITLAVLLILCGILLLGIILGAAVLVDPIIAILVIWGVVVLVKKLFHK